MFLGIDYGTRKVSLAALPPSGGGAAPVVFSHFCRRNTYTARSETQQLHHLAQLVVSWITASSVHHACAPSYVVVERPWFGFNKDTGIRLAATAGAISCTIFTAYPEVPIDLVPPAKWKSEVVGDGRANKEDVMTWARNRNLKPENDDEADAAAMAQSAFWRSQTKHPQTR